MGGRWARGRAREPELKLRLETPPLEPVRDVDRLTHARPVVALVAEIGRDEALATLRGPGVAYLRTALRASPGFQLEGELLASHPSSTREAMARALAALGDHRLLVAEGPLALDVLRADLSIAILPSETALLHARDLRAVRHRIDLFLYEARPALLRALAGRLGVASDA